LTSAVDGNDLPTEFNKTYDSVKTRVFYNILIEYATTTKAVKCKGKGKVVLYW